MLNKDIFLNHSSLNFKKIVVLTLVTSLFFLALFMRFGMVEKTKMSSPIRNDASEYYSYSINLKTFGIYSKTYPSDTHSNTLKPDKHRPPGYALFLLPFVEYPPTFDMVSHIIITQAIISAFTVLLCFFLFRLFLSTSISILAMSLVAVSPHLIAMDIYILSESLFTFFLVLVAFCMSKLILNQNKYWAYALGIVLGISLLIKPTMTYFLIFLFIGLFFLLDKKHYKKIMFIILAGYLTSYSPWIFYKNISLGDRPSTLTLASLHNGMYIGLMHNNDPRTRGIPHRTDPDYNKIKDTNALLKELFNRVKQQPLDYLNWYFIEKPIMFFSWSMVAGMGDIFVYPIHHSPYQYLGLYKKTHTFMQTLHGFLMILGTFMSIVIWLPIAKKSLSKNSLLIGRLLSTLVFYFIIVHCVGTPLPRYSIPLRPLMYAFSLLGFQFLFNMTKSFSKGLD